MDESTQILRLDMNGRWSPDDLVGLLTSVSDLYHLRLILEVTREDYGAFLNFYNDLDNELRQLDSDTSVSGYLKWRARRTIIERLFAMPLRLAPQLPLNHEQLNKLSQLLRPNTSLDIREISYASPGFTDLAGLGAIIGHVKDFALRTIELWIARGQRRLAEEHSSLENDALRIQNARSFVALASEMGYSATEIRELINFVDQRQEIFAHLAQQEKITGVTSFVPQNDPRI